MNRYVELIDQALTLERFPFSQDPNLQAWDAADEYLLNQLRERGWLQQGGTIHIYNDTFGALTTALVSWFAEQNCSDYNIINRGDSFLSHQGCRNNLQDNRLADDRVVYVDSLQDVAEAADLVLLKVPKNHTLLQQQLAQVKATATEHTKMLAAAKAKALTRNVIDMFNQLGAANPSLAWKKCRVVDCQIEPTSDLQVPDLNVWPLENTEYNLVNHANVFARQYLDIGARFFLQYLPKEQQYHEVIDLGCGNGVLSLMLLAQNKIDKLIAIDESYMALASTEQTIKENLPAQLVHCQFQANNCLDGFEGARSDLVVCNPPFHQNNAITDDIAWQMFRDAKRVLKRGGKLMIVGNQHLAYHIKLQRLFGNCETLASNKKFVILEAVK
ncbi:methyltransferase domain-containing protein [Corallincola holothuriorum]|uniref:Ribosomal RNA large subunit methyltransferase G n=1 Tax=Corallincola holothuriorum TaxID=2282215 RepID=A0A368NEZ0_9GAMM|nr:methyltransferase [Corallincola holothuriorum]RCU49142.1 methyltransferase domain-containing protein [Corallincola holothuriorum]